MATDSGPVGVELGDDYYHVRYRESEEFDEIRTPDWAANVANSVVQGGEVRTGDEHGNENWTVQSVLVPVDAVANEDEASQAAQRIVEKMES